MRTKRKPSVDDAFDKGYHSFAATPGDTAVFAIARAVMRVPKRTFIGWLALAEAAAHARSIADGRGSSITAILEREGITLDRSTCSNLEKIWSELPTIAQWHFSLPPEERARKSAPTTVLTHLRHLRQPAGAEPSAGGKGEVA